MSILQPAKNQTAYLKAGILGFQGSGKTFTGTRLAAGLAKLSGKENPKVAFFDTEKGSDFFVQYFKENGIQFDVAKSRTFIDLLEFIREVEKGQYDVAIIDSISHIWLELQQSYEKKLRRSNGLLFQDWGKVKMEWRQFTDAFINSKIHMIVCGRAGYEYDFEQNEAGKKELIKTGVKMKAEGEFGYESDILLEMERVGDADGKGYFNVCTVIKDRTNTMNGKTIRSPKFDDFAPIVKLLNIGGDHVGFNPDRDSTDLFDDPDYSYAERKKQQTIALEELQDVLLRAGLSGTAQAVQLARSNALKEIYGTSSKTEIEGMSAEKIREGVMKIMDKFELDKSEPDEKAPF